MLEIGPRLGRLRRPRAAGRHPLHRHHQLRRCRKLSQRDKLANFGDRFDILLTDFYDFEPKEPFDAIVIMGVIEHLPNYERVLKKFYRLLKPGGLVFLDGSAARKKYELSTFMVRHIYPGNHSFLVLDDFLNKLDKTDVRAARRSTTIAGAISSPSSSGRRSSKPTRTTSAKAFGDFEFRNFRLYLWGAAYEFLAAISIATE